MFEGFTTFKREQQYFAPPVVNELPVVLEMPTWQWGKTVPTSEVVMALLWQHYGLDLLHPEVSQWLERNAPDVKYAIAENRFASDDDGGNTEFRVRPDGTIKVYLSPEVDDRLREVSSHYILTQVGDSMESQKEQDPQPEKRQVAPEIIKAITTLKQVRHSMRPRRTRHSTESQKEQIAPEIIQAITAQAKASGLSVNDYLARLVGLQPRRKDELSLVRARHAAETRPLAPYELVTDIMGSKDSGPPEDPHARHHRPPIQPFVAENLKK